MSGEYLLNNIQSNVTINISVSGDLVVEGQTIAEITVRGDEPNVISVQDGERVTVECDGDCWLHVPEGALLTICQVDGGAKISGIKGFITIGQVDGDLTLRDVRDVQINNVDGDLLTMRAGGSVKVDNISGRAKFQKITGHLEVGSIGGAALITDVDGNCSVDDVGEGLALSLHFKPRIRYHFNVGEGVLCGVITADSVRFTMPEETATNIHVPGANSQLDGILRTVIVGNGDALVKFDSIGGTFNLDAASELIHEIPAGDFLH